MWDLRFHVLTQTDRTRVLHVCVLLSADPHVRGFDYSDDPLNPYEVHVRVEFLDGHQRPSHPDLQRLSPHTTPLHREIPDLALEAQRIEAANQRARDRATEEIRSQPELPGWVRPDRWVRHTREGWVARVTEIITGIITRVRYTRDDAGSAPAFVTLPEFIASFAPSDKPPSPPAFYQRLLTRRRTRSV